MEHKLPQIKNAKLAEFMGYLLGDGHLGLYKYEISITGNKVQDIATMKFVSETIFELFGITPKIYVSKNRNVIRCKFYSKVVQHFITEKFKFKSGNKLKNMPKIPTIFFENELLLSSCLRGIFDTDGCICRHREKDPMIEIDACNMHLRDSILKALETLKIRHSFVGRKIYIYSKKEIVKFFNIVGSRNEKNLLKYAVWVKNGFVPKSSMIIDKNKGVMKTLLSKSINKELVMFDPDYLFKCIETRNYLTCADSLAVT
jgi:DNA-binding transcriptional regulator WhiA